MLNGFDALVEKSMADWKIPGLALAVIRDGEPVLMRGYGVRDSAGSAPVTTATQFMLCSITKSFTAAGLGLLVDERRLDWATPVRDLIPGFRLHDAVATDRITVRDLLCHHSGMPRHDWLHTPGDLDTSELLARLRHLAPSRDLRERWQYQNLGYVIAGHVAERLSGQRWEDFTEERLLRPLGFARFGFSAESLAAAPDHAHPHTMVASECLRANWSSIVKPAGGLATSVEDLAKWMRCLLDEGKVGGRALLSPAIVRDMMTPGVHIGMSEFPEVGDQHYGLGLTVEQYRGERTVSHSGSWLGWAALMTLMPSRRIGIAVLTNRAPSAVTGLLTCAALDQLCGHPPIDWLTRMQARRHEMLAQLQIDQAARQARQHTGTSPSHPLHDYAGNYSHPAYGQVTIGVDGDGLSWRWRGMSGQLAHRHYDVFSTAEKPAEIYPDNLALTFLYNREGTIDRIAAPLEPLVDDIVFHRVPSGDATTAEFRARCVGAYRHSVQHIEVALDAAGHLLMTIAGQPRYHLRPCHGRTFEIAELPRWRVEFRAPTQEAVDALELFQPNGTFLALRVQP
ncbi:MAG: serine hydrolase [Cupriavidus necator]